MKLTNEAAGETPEQAFYPLKMVRTPGADHSCASGSGFTGDTACGRIFPGWSHSDRLIT